MHRTQFSRSPANALDRTNDSKAVDSFCAAGNGRGQIEIGLASGLLWPGATLNNRETDRPDRHCRGIAGER
jgi:hypothetical protein